MSDVPETPKDFFTQYIPSRFEAMKSAFAGKTSAGSMVFRVSGAGEWTLTLEAGELVVSEGQKDDVIIQVTVSEDDFTPIFVQAALQQEDEPIKPEQQVMAFKAITVDEERAKLVRGIAGSVAFVVSDDEKVHKLVITPGAAKPNLDAPDCRLECSMNDFLDMQTGKQNPMQLAMGGKIKIVGNAQIPMALSGVFV
ncbi:MAG: SCP2 sterol-binding domain-containing protein [Myxococcales bacterium]|nr:SCP2 sterol-binding domain-containing protein [Myxococcales bacterium]MCB9582696.1 SCP2 sterol-binding domain-containing protein [Polyangiaceae bacterium]